MGCVRFIISTLGFLCITASLYADQLIIEPDMGRKPIQQAMQHAQKSIHLVMYGITDEALLDTLIQQKQRDRTIKMILERHPYKAIDENNKAIKKLDANHVDWQGDISPFRLIHQKTLILDGHEAIIMTFNFTKSTFTKQRNFALRIDDPKKVADIASVFASDWNHKPAQYHSPDLIYSPNDSRIKILSLINHAKHTIKVYAQNVSDYKIIGALANAARHGVTVDILTSVKQRSTQIHYLTKAGVTLHQSTHYYIHAKAFIIDNQTAIIGSINFTRVSLDDNRELSVVTRDPYAIKSLSETFNRDWDDSVNFPD